jgi:hypothetical protein
MDGKQTRLRSTARSRPEPVTSAGQGSPKSPALAAGIHAVLVAGMHRSGTSALGQLLATAGLYDGPIDGHMAPTLENPDGYAELQAIADFHDSVLAARGWYWDAPSAEPSSDANERGEIVKQGRRLISSNMRSAPLWFVKDPRLSLVLPLWRRILLDRFVVVFTVRPAIEVAWSLAVRDGFPISLGLALWAAYYRHLAAGLNGLTAIAVDYVALTEKPLETTRQLLSALRRSGVELDAEPETAAVAIQPALRRATVPHQVTEVDAEFTMEDVLPGWRSAPVITFDRFDLAPGKALAWETDILLEHRQQRESALEASSRRTEASRVTAERDQLAAERDELSSERDLLSSERDLLSSERDLLSIERDQAASERDLAISERRRTVTERDLAVSERNQAASERDRAASERDQLLTTLEESQQEREQIAADRAQLVANRDELAARGELLNASHEDLTVTLARLRQELDAIGAEREQLQLERRDLVETLDTSIADRDSLIAERDTLIADRGELMASQTFLSTERDELREALASREALLRVYEGSTSWRWTAPARNVGIWLRSIRGRR